MTKMRSIVSLDTTVFFVVVVFVCVVFQLLVLRLSRSCYLRQKYEEQRECQPWKQHIFLLARDCYVSVTNKQKTTQYTVIEDGPAVHRKYHQLPQVLAETPKNVHDKVPKTNVNHAGNLNDLDMHASNGTSNCAGNSKTLFGIIWFSRCLDR